MFSNCEHVTGKKMKGQDIVILVWIANEEATGNKDFIRDLAHDLNI